DRSTNMGRPIMAKLVSRRRMLTGHCHGFHWLRARREKPIATGAMGPRPHSSSYLFDEQGFMECRDYDRGGQLVRWRLYHVGSRSATGLTWAWELIEGRLYDAEGKRLATFGEEGDFGLKTAPSTVTTYVYDGTKRLSRIYDDCS